MNEESQHPSYEIRPGFEGLLSEALAGEGRYREDLVQRVLASVDGETAASNARRWMTRWGSTGIAAAVAVVVVGFLWLGPTSQTVQAVATVRDFAGEVFVRSSEDGLLLPMSRGLILRAGDTVICREDGNVTADYSNGSSVSLLGGELHFEETGRKGENALMLESGRALCQLAGRSAEDQSLAFATPHAGGRGTDTTFELFVDDDGTRVRTLTGDVRVWNLGNTGHWAPVAAGSAAMVRDGVPLRADTFDLESIQPGDVVWAQDFDSHFQAGGDIEGRLMTVREGERLTTMIRSIPTGPLNREPEFSPDEWISLELASRQTLFLLPEEMELILWVRCETPGSLRVALNPGNPTFKREHAITEPVDIATEWRRLAFSADHFNAYLHSRPVSAGYPVRSLALWGFGTETMSLDRVIVRRRLR